MDEPKKYIRTLAGDMEAVKKGIVPNLSPLKAPVPTVPTVPVPAPTPVPEPSPAPPSPVPAPIPVPIQNPVKSYSSDFIQKVKETHASTATVLAAEQDASPPTKFNAPEKSSKSNIVYIIAGVLLLILGIVGSYITYSRYLENAEPVILAPEISAPIFVDKKEKISGTSPKDLLLAIKQSLTRSLAPNTVRFLYTDSATTTDKSVFGALQLPAPSALLRNINASRSMAGIVSAGGSQNLFFILSVASYGDTFSGMLSWEPTMVRDLSDLFPSYLQTLVGTTTIATSTPVSIPAFRDEVVNNHDTRVYRDSEERSILLYGYWNQTTLVIARDPAAFIEIIGRLATTRTQ